MNKVRVIRNLVNSTSVLKAVINWERSKAAHWGSGPRARFPLHSNRYYTTLAADTPTSTDVQIDYTSGLLSALHSVQGRISSCIFKLPATTIRPIIYAVRPGVENSSGPGSPGDYRFYTATQYLEILSF
jgi:hypothetical protein